MNINFKNLSLYIVLILFTALSFSIISDILKVEYYKSIIKENSVEYSYDDDIYREIETILPKFFNYLKNKEYSKIMDVSIFYADKSQNEYDKISEKLNLSSEYKIVIEEIYKVDNDIFRSICYTKVGDKLSEKCIITIKIDSNEKYFKILDIII